ncbi:MAG: hypothetical protein LBM75_11625 [Myxococcales bacterium]|nr:hypothetical protein [Myxococcales bacterium]
MLPKHRRVERTFSWLNNYRRLAKDYEITTTSEESYVEISCIALLLRRLFKACIQVLKLKNPIHGRAGRRDKGILQSAAIVFDAGVCQPCKV